MKLKLINQENRGSIPLWLWVVIAIGLFVALIFVIAIVTILIPIIMQVIGTNVSDPTDETHRMLSNAVDNPSALQYTPDVAFQPGDVLSAQAITERTGISKEQICMGALAFGEESENDDFEVWKGGASHGILYHGSGTTVKIAILCNVSFDDLENDIEAYGLEDEINLDNCPDECKKSGTCCAVMLIRT